MSQRGADDVGRSGKAAIGEGGVAGPADSAVIALPFRAEFGDGKSICVRLFDFQFLLAFSDPPAACRGER